MIIEQPNDLTLSIEYDAEKHSLQTEVQILSYTEYLKGIAEQLGMQLVVSKVPHNEPQLDEDDIRLLDTMLPLYNIAIYDDGDMLAEFSYDYYGIDLYTRFKSWVKNDILYYMKSKAIFLELWEKHPERIERINWRFKPPKI